MKTKLSFKPGALIVAFITGGLMALPSVLFAGENPDTNVAAKIDSIKAEYMENFKKIYQALPEGPEKQQALAFAQSLQTGRPFGALAQALASRSDLVRNEAFFVVLVDRDNLLRRGLIRRSEVVLGKAPELALGEKLPGDLQVLSDGVGNVKIDNHTFRVDFKTDLWTKSREAGPTNAVLALFFPEPAPAQPMAEAIAKLNTETVEAIEGVTGLHYGGADVDTLRRILGKQPETTFDTKKLAAHYAAEISIGSATQWKEKRVGPAAVFRNNGSIGTFTNTSGNFGESHVTGMSKWEISPHGLTLTDSAGYTYFATFLSKECDEFVFTVSDDVYYGRRIPGLKQQDALTARNR